MTLPTLGRCHPTRERGSLEPSVMFYIAWLLPFSGGPLEMSLCQSSRLIVVRPFTAQSPVGSPSESRGALPDPADMEQVSLGRTVDVRFLSSHPVRMTRMQFTWTPCPTSHDPHNHHHHHYQNNHDCDNRDSLGADDAEASSSGCRRKRGGRCLREGVIDVRLRTSIQ